MPTPDVMIEWSDPRIIVAIGTGVFGTLSGLGGLVFSAYVFSRQGRQAKNQTTWEEYRETVYDPLRSALQHVEDFAKRCRGTHDSPQNEEERNKFFRDLSETMNEVEIACAKADNHGASDCKNWTKQVEAKTKKIYDLIDDRGLVERLVERGDPDLLALGECLRAYLRFFEDRLREQRIGMLKF